MAMDPLERELLRRKMAAKFNAFLEGGSHVSCVSGHFYEEPHFCDLCQVTHADTVVVIKNRSGRKMVVGTNCLKEMVRFQVAEVEEFQKWLQKIDALKAEAEKRKEEIDRAREEERKKLEKKVIIRKRQVQENI